MQLNSCNNIWLSRYGHAASSLSETQLKSLCCCGGNRHKHVLSPTITHCLSLTLAQGAFLEVHIFAYICMFNEFWEIKRSEQPFVGISFIYFFIFFACMCVEGGRSLCKYHPLCVGTRHRWSWARAPCGHRIPISVCVCALCETKRPRLSVSLSMSLSIVSSLRL